MQNNMPLNSQSRAPLRQLYRSSLSLLTDLYQLTMAYSYWKSGLADQQAVFHLFFRKIPFANDFAIATGLEAVVDYLAGFHFSEEDVAYLATLTGNDGQTLFEPGFLDYLQQLKLDCDVLAVPEGTVVFPHEPLLRVQGSLLQCQLLETPLLNLINFPTLIATKSARICAAAGDEPVLEFGLRRAQGIDGGATASRAAYIGGCAATSNVLAGQLHGVPVRGTHAHSWVMSFDDELESFIRYAEAMPNNCIFLVDTYDTLEGVKKAIIAGQQLRESGHEMIGIRLDSGDMADLSISARKLLDDAGFPQAKIVASSDLDEYKIKALKAQGAQIQIWGVGTRLATAYEQPALGGVYKLAAIQDENKQWKFRVKRSNDSIKVSNPGILQVYRFQQDNIWLGDVLVNELDKPQLSHIQWQNFGEQNLQTMPVGAQGQALLQPVMHTGKIVYQKPTLPEIQAYAKQQRLAFQQQQTKKPYPVGLETNLLKLKQKLMQTNN